jgi:hypothetical protein
MLTFISEDDRIRAQQETAGQLYEFLVDLYSTVVHLDSDIYAEDIDKLSFLSMTVLEMVYCRAYN